MCFLFPLYCVSVGVRDENVSVIMKEVLALKTKVF